MTCEFPVATAIALMAPELSQPPVFGVADGLPGAPRSSETLTRSVPKRMRLGVFGSRM